MATDNTSDAGSRGPMDDDEEEGVTVPKIIGDEYFADLVQKANLVSCSATALLAASIDAHRMQLQTTDCSEMYKCGRRSQNVVISRADRQKSASRRAVRGRR